MANLKVLIVDDDERNIFALEMLLDQLDYEVLSCESGIDAIKVLEVDSSINIVLMDIMMPNMNGYEAIANIRQGNGVNKDVPIVAVTARAMPEDRTKCIEAGANDYLSKPIDVSLLDNMMKGLLA